MGLAVCVDCGLLARFSWVYDCLLFVYVCACFGGVVFAGFRLFGCFGHGVTTSTLLRLLGAYCLGLLLLCVFKVYNYYFVCYLVCGWLVW